MKKFIAVLFSVISFLSFILIFFKPFFNFIINDVFIGGLTLTFLYFIYLLFIWLVIKVFSMKTHLKKYNVKDLFVISCICTLIIVFIFSYICWLYEYPNPIIIN